LHCHEEHYGVVICVSWPQHPSARCVMCATVSALQRLLRVLEIVAKSSAPPVNEDGEAEVDIDALDNATLLELEDYVNGVLDVRFGLHDELLTVCAARHTESVTR
jgi:Bromodomain extra-terminal - transcription regulation